MVFSKDDPSKTVYLRTLKFIRQNPGCDRGEIKDAIGVSYPTVIKIVNNLVEKELINSTEDIRLKHSAMYFWGISFGATQIKICLIDFEFRVKETDKYKEYFRENISKTEALDDPFDAAIYSDCLCFPTPKKYSDFVILFNEILYSIRRFCEGNPDCNVRGIGISFSGAVDKVNRILKESNNIEYLKDVLLDKIIRPTTLDFFCEQEIPIVYNHNAKAAAISEKEYLFIEKEKLKISIGIVEKKRNIACIYLGSGIGAGFILDNKLYSGSNNFSGEICHLPIFFSQPNDDSTNEFYDFYSEKMPTCTCGSNRCLECYIRLIDRFLSLVTDENGQFSDEIASRNRDGEYLSGLIKKWKNNDGASNTEIMDLLREKCKSAYTKLAQLIGYTIIALANTLNIDLFICTGRLTKYYNEVENRIRDIVATNGLSYIRNSCVIMESKNGKLAPAIGSAIEAAFCYLDDELAWDI